MRDKAFSCFSKLGFTYGLYKGPSKGVCRGKGWVHARIAVIVPSSSAQTFLYKDL